MHGLLLLLLFLVLTLIGFLVAAGSSFTLLVKPKLDETTGLPIPLTSEDVKQAKATVEKRLNEFAILIQARLSNAQYEWWAHEPIAHRAGLSEAVTADLRECRRPAAMRDDERLVFDYCLQLSLNHRVPDALWQQAVDAMGEQAVIDLTVLSGTYVMVSMLLNATQVGIPDGGALPLTELDPLEIRRRLLA